MCDQERKRSILVVDDNPDNLKLLAKLLGEHDYKVRLAPNGSHALTTIKKEAPDLVLLDIMMPDMDGFEVSKRIKSNNGTRHIPIIFISALDQTEDKVKAFSLGGVDYISKPFEEREVLARINTHLTINDLQRQLEKKNSELQKALDEIKTLRGVIPICASCKKIRKEDGSWEQIEVYIKNRSEADFTHGVCDDCAREIYPEYL